MNEFYKPPVSEHKVRSNVVALFASQDCHSMRRGSLAAPCRDHRVVCWGFIKAPMLFYTWPVALTVRNLLENPCRLTLTGVASAHSDASLLAGTSPSSRRHGAPGPQPRRGKLALFRQARHAYMATIAADAPDTGRTSSGTASPSLMHMMAAMGSRWMGRSSPYSPLHEQGSPTRFLPRSGRSGRPSRGAPEPAAESPAARTAPRRWSRSVLEGSSQLPRQALAR